MTTARPTSAETASIAAHRFGLGEADLAVVGADPRRWLLDQLGPAEQPPADAEGFLSSADLVQMRKSARRAKKAAKQEKSAPRDQADPGDPQVGQQLRQGVLAEAAWRYDLQLHTRRPFTERLVRFWANHFTVSGAKGAVRPVVGAFEREVVRPHVSGRFVDLLRASTTHVAMLVYLDNAQSVGPGSRAGQRRGIGLNENLAREVLELHTLGVRGGYGQADVLALAQILTGWTVEPETARTRFTPNRHEPGPKRLLGKTYPEAGEAELAAALEDLARHPSTARFLATKLVRHFVADAPPDALVDAVAAAYRASDGDLTAVYQALVQHPLALAPGLPKFKLPEEWALTCLRLVGVPKMPPARLVRGIAGFAASVGQKPGEAPSPAGWADVASEWLGPDALSKRIEWAQAASQRLPTTSLPDARALATTSFGPRLSATTAQELARAESPRQALALFWLSPEMQRR
jgi:uncharacterized protein (DUF1800 family)